MNIYFKDYVHLVEDGDCTLAVWEALRECAEHPQATLLFEKGTYHFKSKYAYQKEYYMSNNDYSLKSIIFPLFDRKELTIDGGGSDFIMHGEVLPFVLDRCDNITLKHFSVDYIRPFFSQARIIASGNGYTDLEFDTDQYPFKIENEAITFVGHNNETYPDSELIFLVTEFDIHTGGPTAYNGVYIIRFPNVSTPAHLEGLTKDIRAEQRSVNRIRLHGIDNHQAGNYWTATHARRDYPGIFINESKDTLLQDINLYHAPSMGVMGQVSENITLERVHTIVRPESNRCISVNVDSTHFVNCSGQINLYDCTFTNMMDDAGNFHGNYTKVDKIINPHTLLVRFGHSMQKGVMIYKPGDTIHFVAPSTLQTYAVHTVRQAEWLSGDYVRIEMEEALPDKLAIGDAVENYSRMPSVHIKGCVSGNNRPRGFLIATNRKVLIEDCMFYNMWFGIQMTGDAGAWCESGPVKDVTIRNNYFRNASYVGGAAIAVTPHVPVKENNYYHSGIKIEDNTFELHDKRFLHARNSKNIEFRNNRYIRNLSLTPQEQVGDNGIELIDCSDCFIEPVVEVES